MHSRHALYKTSHKPLLGQPPFILNAQAVTTAANKHPDHRNTPMCNYVQWHISHWLCTHHPNYFLPIKKEALTPLVMAKPFKLCQLIPQKKTPVPALRPQFGKRLYTMDSFFAQQKPTHKRKLPCIHLN